MGDLLDDCLELFQSLGGLVLGQLAALRIVAPLAGLQLSADRHPHLNHRADHLHGCYTKPMRPHTTKTQTSSQSGNIFIFL